MHWTTAKSGIRSHMNTKCQCLLMWWLEVSSYQDWAKVLRMAHYFITSLTRFNYCSKVTPLFSVSWQTIHRFTSAALPSAGCLHPWTLMDLSWERLWYYMALWYNIIFCHQCHDMIAGHKGESIFSKQIKCQITFNLLFINCGMCIAWMKKQYILRKCVHIHHMYTL